MAKSHTKTSLKSQPKALANGAHQASAESASLPCYILSLEIENIRCFGSKQKLNLSDKEGRPAQWTIILGENGTGKTTLLQTIACLELMSLSNRTDRERLRVLGSQQRPGIDSFISVLNEFPVTDPLELTRTKNYITHVSCQVSWTCQQTLRSLSFADGDAYWKFEFEKTHLGIASDKPPPALIFYAYGAGRRLSGVSLRQEPIDDPVGTLFNENALLRNAEEWLLQLDYAASKESEVQAKQKSRLEQVKQLLIAHKLQSSIRQQKSKI